MFHRFFVALHLLAEAGAARRDARVRWDSHNAWIRFWVAGHDHNVADVIGIVMPRTYCRWVRELKEGRRPNCVGRPGIARNMRRIVIRLARENAGWGYRRIIGELRKLRLKLGRSSVRRILRDEGLTPSPLRRGKAGEITWQRFIRLHLNTLVACDFFTKSVITPLGPRIAYSPAFIHIGTGKVSLSPPTYHPNE